MLPRSSSKLFESTLYVVSPRHKRTRATRRPVERREERLMCSAAACYQQR